MGQTKQKYVLDPVYTSSASLTFIGACLIVAHNVAQGPTLVIVFAQEFEAGGTAGHVAEQNGHKSPKAAQNGSAHNGSLQNGKVRSKSFWLTGQAV